MRVQWVTIQGRTFRRSFCHSGQVGARGELGCGKVNRSYQWIEERLNEVVEAALKKRRPEPQTASAEDLSGEINVLEDRIRGLRARWKEDEMDDEDYFNSLQHLRGQLQDLRTREAASAVRKARTEADALAVWQDEDVTNLERRRAIVSSVIEEVEVYSIGKGRKKPPEPDSITIWPVGSKQSAQEA